MSDLELIVDLFHRAAKRARQTTHLFIIGVVLSFGAAPFVYLFAPDGGTRAACAVLFGLLCLGLLYANYARIARYTDETRSPVLAALTSAPEEIAHVMQRELPRQGVLQPGRQYIIIVLRNRQRLGVEFESHERERLLDALQRLSPSAIIDGRRAAR
jgi:hypothetical protein